MTSRVAPVLHLVTDRRRLAPEARTAHEEAVRLVEQIALAIEAGIDVVQVRERDLDAARLLDVVGQSVRLATGTSTRILVNERADVARAAGAAGVHLPASGIAADRVRSLDPAWLIGRSIHGDDTPPDREACDYLLFGTVFPSASKGMAPTSGLDGLRRAAARLAQPVLAIGGIDPATAGACVEAGAAGVAAIGAFLSREPRHGLVRTVSAFRDALARE